MSYKLAIAILLGGIIASIGYYAFITFGNSGNGPGGLATSDVRQAYTGTYQLTSSPQAPLSITSFTLLPDGVAKVAMRNNSGTAFAYVGVWQRDQEDLMVSMTVNRPDGEVYVSMMKNPQSGTYTIATIDTTLFGESTLVYSIR